MLEDLPPYDILDIGIVEQAADNRIRLPIEYDATQVEHDIQNWLLKKSGSDRNLGKLRFDP